MHLSRFTGKSNNSTDPVEFKKLQSVVDDTPEGKAIFAAYAAETVTFADLLRDFKSIRVSANTKNSNLFLDNGQFSFC